MAGRITYPVTLANTPMQSPFTVANIFALGNVFAGSLNIGDTQDIYLYWGYKANDPYHDDTRNVSKSSAGVIEITSFGTTQGFKFTLPMVIENRLAQVNEYAIMNALNDEGMLGAVFNWYPDYDNYPAEYYSCVMTKRLDQKRNSGLPLWDFSFDMTVLPSVQFPSTVPAFQVS